MRMMHVDDAAGKTARQLMMLLTTFVAAARGNDATAHDCGDTATDAFHVDHDKCSMNPDWHIFCLASFCP